MQKNGFQVCKCQAIKGSGSWETENKQHKIYTLLSGKNF